MDDGADFRVYLAVIWRRRYTIGAVTLMAILTAGFSSFFIMRPSYEASTLLKISAPRVQFPGISVPSIGPASTAETLIPMVNNKIVAGLAAKRLRRSRAVAPDVLLKRVRMTSLGADLLRVTAWDSSPADAAALAGAWGEAVVAYVDSSGAQEIHDTLAILQPKFASAQTALDEAEKSLTTFQSRSQIQLLGERVQVAVHRIVFLESRLEEYRQGGRPLDGEVFLSPSSYGYALMVISPRDPVQIQRLVAVLKSNLARDQAALAADKQREAQLTDRVNIANLTYQFLAQQRNQLQVLLAGSTGPVKITAAPTVPDTAVIPGKRRVILAAILGVVAGIFLAFIMEHFSAPAPALIPRGSSNPAPSRR